MGAAVGLGLGTVGHHLIRFAFLSAIVLGTLLVVLAGLFLTYLEPLVLDASGRIILSPDRFPTMVPVMGAVMAAIAWAVVVFFEAAVTDMALRHISDDGSSVHAALWTALRRCVPLMLQRLAFYAVVAVVAVPLALTFLIGGYLGGPPGGPIPHLLTVAGPVLAVLAVIWLNLVHAFATAVLIGEEAGFLGSLGRSARLSRGNRLRLVFLIAFFIVLAALPVAALDSVWDGGLMGIGLVGLAVLAVYLLFVWLWAVAATAAACCEVLASQLSPAPRGPAAVPAQ